MTSVFHKYDYGRWWKHPVRTVKYLLRDFRYGIQRAQKGYCDRDLWSIHDWFLQIMPEMLEEYKDTRHGSPGCLGENHTNERGILVNDTCHEEWTKILEQMIFLFREADEETCDRKNPYEEAHTKAQREFRERYGSFGEKLLTEKEREEKEAGKGTRVHFLDEIPEYQEIHERYMEEERKLQEYRERCKDEAFLLFSKWFYYLWD